MDVVMLFNIFSSLVAFVPSLFLVAEIVMHLDMMNYKILSLTATNFTGLLPTSLCLYYIYTKQANMFVEMLPFALIVLSSGTYHLCNSINYESSLCAKINNEAFYADFINSYYCISTVILYAIKLEFFMDSDRAIKIRRILYFLHLIIYFCMIIYQNNIFIPLIYTLFLLLISVIIFGMNINKYRELIIYENKRVNLAIGVTLALFSLLIYVFTVYFSIEDNSDYWFLHSFCWHVPVMMSSMFIMEAFIIQSNHVSFTYYIIGRINCTNNMRQCQSANNLGIELTLIDINDEIIDQIMDMECLQI